jgi:hypothetical protein
MTSGMITEANQTRLVKALDKAIDKYTGGLTPSASVAKSAAESGLNGNYAQRLTHMFNAAVTLEHLDSFRKDGEKRASSFPLANYDEVWSEMRKKQPETAKAAASVPVKDHTAGYIPGGNFDWGLPKAASVVKSASLDDQARKKFSVKKAAIEAHAAAETDYYEKRERVSDAVEGIVSALKRTDACDWNTFSKVASNTYPDSADWLKVVEERLGAKRAGYVNRSPAAVTDVCNQFGNLLIRARVAKMAAEMSKQAAGFDVNTILTGGIPSNLYSGIQRAEDQEVPPTTFFKRLAAMEGFVNLSKLRAMDPVIGAPSTNQDTVTRLYGELSKANPQLAKQPALMRGYLRRGLESSPDEWGKGLDTFETKQLMELENPDPLSSSWIKSDAPKPKVRTKSSSSAPWVGGLAGLAGGLGYTALTADEDTEVTDYLRNGAIGGGLGGVGGLMVDQFKDPTDSGDTSSVDVDTLKSLGGIGAGGLIGHMTTPTGGKIGVGALSGAAGSAIGRSSANSFWGDEWGDVGSAAGTGVAVGLNHALTGKATGKKKWLNALYALLGSGLLQYGVAQPTINKAVDSADKGIFGWLGK